MLTLEEAIKHCEEVAENNEKIANTFEYSLKTKSDCKKCAKEHRQLAEWLRELKIHREIHEVLLQTLLDCDLDICCDDLMDDDDEVCMENCNNKTKDCWLRWAKLKARERSESE